MRGLRVAIAGCGPCGLATALLLHRQGQQVTLFERFEKPKPVGSGLMIQPTGLAVLRKLGLAERIASEGARVDRLFGRAGDRVVLDVAYRNLGKDGQFGVGIHRSSLFVALYDAVRAAGIAVRSGRVVTGSRIEGARRRLAFADGMVSEPFDLVVDALGTRTPLSERCGRELPYGALWATLESRGFDEPELQQRYRRSSKMVGILPIGRGDGRVQRIAFFWSMRCDAFDRWQSTPLISWKEEVKALWPACEPLLAQISTHDQLTFARYSHRTLKEPLEPAQIHLGDAWHSASPQLGQGANMALLDAWALACSLERAGSLPEALQIAIGLRRKHVRIYQWLTDIFTPVYQSDSVLLPFLRDWMVGPLSKMWPATRIQAAMVSGLVGDPLRSLGLE